MIHQLRHLRAGGAVALVFMALALLPAAARAEALGFRNDTTAPIIVQGASMVQGGVQRDRPHLLQKNEACRIVLPGNKLITIYNAKMPNQVLFQTTIPAAAEDQFFSVCLDPIQKKVVIQPVERVKPGPR